MGTAVNDCRLALRVTMRCWGDFALADANSGAELRPRGRKARALVAYLAMHPGSAVNRERLMGLLWGDRAEEQARASLRQALQELKPLANGSGLIAVERDRVTLDPAGLTTDLEVLRSTAQRGGWAELVDALPEPHERLFADLDGLDSGFDDWLGIERARQGDALTALLLEAQAEAQRAGCHREARLLATRLRERDPDVCLPPPEDAPPSERTSPPPETTNGVPPSQRKSRARFATMASAALLVAAAGIAAGVLGVRSPPAPAPSSSLETSGAVHSLYLRARAKIHERNPQATEEARGLLDRAVALDPNFAPVWSSLAQVTWFEANQAGAAGERIRGEARARARRALQLAPDLAEANAVMAMVLSFEGEEGRGRIQRATELDPGNQEYRYWLGHAYSNALDYPNALAAYRAAFEMDPTWWPVVSRMTELAWSMGRREEARTYLRRVEREVSAYHAGLLRGFVAGRGGDLSQAADAFQQARGRTDDLGKQAVAVYNRAVILFALGFVDAAQREWASCRLRWAEGRSSSLTMPERFAGHLALQRGQLPSAQRLAELNRATDDGQARAFVKDAATRMISSGRAAEAAALYDGPDGLLGFSAGKPVPGAPTRLVAFAPTVAAVLAASGRKSEARRLLLAVDQQIELALRRSRNEVSADFWGAAAAAWSLLGRHEAAMAALERAVRNGWINADLAAEDLPEDLADEPAFAALRGHPRFEAIRAELNGRLARERAELRPNAV